jgi:hypothetical protein
MLNVDQRRKLLNWYVNIKRKDSARFRRSEDLTKMQNFTFKPVVSEKSYILFENSSKISKNLLERNKQFLEKKQSFIKDKTEEKIKNEVKGKNIYNIFFIDCTFHPRLFPTGSKNKDF